MNSSPNYFWMIPVAPFSAALMYALLFLRTGARLKWHRLIDLLSERVPDVYEALDSPDYSVVSNLRRRKPGLLPGFSGVLP